MASLENTHHYCAFQKHANSEDNFRSQLTIAFFAAVNLLYRVRMFVKSEEVEVEVKRKIGKRKKNDRVDLGTKHDPPFLTQVHRNGRRSFVLRVFLTHQ